MADFNCSRISDWLAFLGSLVLFFPALRSARLKWILSTISEPKTKVLRGVIDDIKNVADNQINGWHILDALALYLGLIALIVSFGMKLFC